MNPAIVNEPKLKPCPFCNTVWLGVAQVKFENGEDEGYKPLCNCGWAGRSIHGWYSNRMNLIEKWNSLIIDADFTEIIE